MATKIFKTEEEYYSDTEYISFSMIKDFLFCEYLFQVKYVDKTFEPLEEPDYFIYGRAVDTILTEPEEEIKKRFMVVERKINGDFDIEAAEKEAKELEKEIREKKATGKGTKLLENKLATLKKKIGFAKISQQKTLVTKSVWEHIEATANELLRQPLYKMFGMREKGKAQEVITATINGIKRKGKLDYIYPEKKIIADIKTTANLLKFDPKDYVMQMAYYRTLAAHKYKIPEEEWDCYLLVGDKHNKFKRSEIFLLEKNLMNAAKPQLEAILKEIVKRIEDGFFTPITENQTYFLARRERCMVCDHYRNCPFSVQKDITLIS